ncbi:MAG: hypothetical protein K2G04_08180 [Oscillospiraceae bacterium]|nr:hypothetical protein [Oscillospiraceae bacterium]
MKLHILCEKCGCDNYKSCTSLIQFKYRSIYHVPIFECAECGQKYAVAATLKAFIFNQCVCFIPPLIFSIWFVYTTANISTFGDKILILICITLAFYAMMLMLYNGLTSFANVKPMSYVIIPVDDELTTVFENDEKAHFCAEAASLTKLAKKLKPRTVYKCKSGSANGAVKLLEFDVTDSGLTLRLKNVSICEKIFDGSEFVLTDAKDREVCRGHINKAACDLEQE